MSPSKKTQETNKLEAEKSVDERTPASQPSDAETQHEGAEVQPSIEITVSEAVSPPTSSKTSDKKKAQPKATKISIGQTSQGTTLISNMKRD